MASLPNQLVSSTTATPKQKTLKFMGQVGLFLGIVAPLCVTVYAAVSLTHGTVRWFYPMAAAITSSIANLGTTAGYHRMLTHQSFKAHFSIQYLLLILGAIAGMASPINWAHDHMHHHSHSDTAEDLHSPHTLRFKGWRLQGMWQWFDSHIGWMFRGQPVEVSKKARQMTDMPAARFVHRTWVLWLAGGLLAPLVFGWNAFLWVGVVRLFLNHHITWSVNSICHMWGRQPFKNTKDKSKNNALVGILAMGEGWHNNHHFRPASARHGILPGQLDLTYTVICLLERCKLVSDVKRYAPCPQCHDWRLMRPDGDPCCTACRKVSVAS